MTRVITLIAAKSHSLTMGRAAECASAVGTSAPTCLSDNEAFDLFIDSRAATNELHTIVRKALGSEPVDIVIQPAEGRRKTLLIADMDSTMIQQECIDELAALIGIRDQVASVTERTMRGELAFEESLRERVSLLAGLATSHVADVIRDRIILTPGGGTLVATMRANGAYAALVSGGFTAFVANIAGRLGFDEYHANALIEENGIYTGQVAEPILGRDAKREQLQRLCRDRSLDPKLTMAVGDGANDLAMIDEASLGVAFRAKPAVAAQADAVINHADLDALLFLQGYARAEFIEPAHASD